MPGEIRKTLDDEKLVSDEFLASVSSFNEGFSLSEIESLIENSNTQLYLEQSYGIAEALYLSLFFIFLNSSRKESKRISRRLGLPFNINPNAPGTSQFLDNYRRDLLSYFIDAQNKASNFALALASLDGKSIRQQARALVDSIGLTEKQLQMIDSYRKSLELGSKSALDRALRDKRSDSTLIRAINTKQPLSSSQIDKLVERYRQRFLKYRANTIAQSEVLTMINVSKDETYQQAIDSGNVSPEEVFRTWETREDSRVRSSHTSMNGQVRSFNDTFISGAGNTLRFPGDPSAPLSERVRCRCNLEITIL